MTNDKLKALEEKRKAYLSDLARIENEEYAIANSIAALDTQIDRLKLDPTDSDVCDYCHETITKATFISWMNGFKFCNETHERKFQSMRFKEA